MRRMSLRALVCTGLVWVGVLDAAGQGRNGPLEAMSVDGKRVRIVFPVEAMHVSRDATRILKVLEDILAQEAPAYGFPDAFVWDRRVTVGLGTEAGTPSSTAKSVPRDALIIVHANSVRSLDASQLRRLLRHEAAHLLVGELLDYRATPRWLQEGFAEWFAGGLTCDGEFRLWIELRRRSAADEELPRLDDASWAVLPSRLAYDFFGSFFEFLEHRHPGLVSDGDLLERVKLDGAFVADSWEAQWHEYLRRKSHREPVCTLRSEAR